MNDNNADRFMLLAIGALFCINASLNNDNTIVFMLWNIAGMIAFIMATLGKRE